MLTMRLSEEGKKTISNLKSNTAPVREVYLQRAKDDAAYLRKTNWKSLGLKADLFSEYIDIVFGSEAQTKVAAAQRPIHLFEASNLFLLSEKEPVHWRRWLAMLAWDYYQSGNLYRARLWAVIAGEKQFLIYLADKGLTEDRLDPGVILLEILCGAPWDAELLSPPATWKLEDWERGRKVRLTTDDLAALFLAAHRSEKGAMEIGRILKRYIDLNESAKGPLIPTPEHPVYEPFATALAILSGLSPELLMTGLQPEKYHKVIKPALLQETKSKAFLPDWFRQERF